MFAWLIELLLDPKKTFSYIYIIYYIDTLYAYVDGSVRVDEIRPSPK